MIGRYFMRQYGGVVVLLTGAFHNDIILYTSMLQRYVWRKNISLCCYSAKREEPLLLAQEDALLLCLKYLVYYIDMFQEQQFKRYYLGQIIANILATLALMYRNSFKLLPVRGGDTIEYFDSLMAISSDLIKDSVCEMMRVLLLKREVRMIHCQTLSACKQFRDSLPTFSQQHIYYCQRIEHILYEEGDLQSQIDNQFQHTPNNTPHFQDHPTAIPAPSAYLIPDQSQPNPTVDVQLDEEASIELNEPLLLDFASQPAIPQDNEAEVNLKKEEQDSQQLVSLTQIQSNSVTEEGADRQGEFEGSTQIIQLLEKQLTEQEIIQKIELYLNDPYSIDLKLIADNLAPFSSKKYYSILLQLFLKIRNNYAQGKGNLKVVHRDVLTKIIQCVPAEFCEPSEELYQVLASGAEGAYLGLRYKGVGMRGMEIYAKKLMSSIDLDELSLYAQLLGERRTYQQLKFLKNCKIHEVIHQKLSHFTSASHPLTPICSLIAETCKYPPLCNAYEIVPQFCFNIMTRRLQPTRRRPLLHALKCLCRGADKHKKQIQNTDFLSELLKLFLEEGKEEGGTVSEEGGTVAELLLMGAEQNIEVAQFYQNQKLEEKVLVMLRRYVELPHYQYELYINALKILELLATLPLSAPRILKGGMMALCKPIAELAVGGGNYDVVAVTVSILRNLMEQMELSLSRVLSEMEKEGLLEYLLMAGQWLARCRQVESYLCIFCRLVTNSAINKKWIQRVESVLRVLNQLARDQLSSHSLGEQWLKVVFLLGEANRYSSLGLVLKSNVFFSAASCLRTAQSVSEGIQTMNKRLMRQLSVKMEMRGLLAFHGYANFLVELLRVGGLCRDDYLKVLSFLSDLFKYRQFTSKLCTQLFAVVMGKLDTHWKDEVTTASITLLKSIRKSVENTQEFGAIMLEFFVKFLSQADKVSSAEYCSVSRDVVCLLSFFLVFNEDIRSLFRSRIVMEILKNWLRIAKGMDYTEMSQSYKLFLYAVYSQQSLYMDLCDVKSKQIGEAEAILQRGWRCNLYRLNGTYKQAILKMDKSKVELVAFKVPDGIIKEKYRIHFKELLIVHRYNPQSETLFAESSFTKAINPFQHTAKPQQCLTFLCLTPHSFEVKQISIEVENISDLQQIYSCTKLLTSRWAQSQIQEQSRVWQMVNQKVL